MNDDEGHVRWWEKEDCFAGRGNGRSPHYQNSRTASLIYWRREGAAVGFLLLYCQQLSICNTEGLLSLLRGNKSPPPPLLYLSQPLAPGFILEMLFEGLWFSCFSSGRFSLWEGFFICLFVLQRRLPLSFPRVCSFCAENLPGDVLKWLEVWFPRQPKAGCHVTHFSTEVSLWGVCMCTQGQVMTERTPHWYTVWQWKPTRKRIRFNWIINTSEPRPESMREAMRGNRGALDGLGFFFCFAWIT